MPNVTEIEETFCGRTDEIEIGFIRSTLSKSRTKKDHFSMAGVSALSSFNTVCSVKERSTEKLIPVPVTPGEPDQAGITPGQC